MEILQHWHVLMRRFLQVWRCWNRCNDDSQIQDNANSRKVQISSRRTFLLLRFKRYILINNIHSPTLLLQKDTSLIYFNFIKLAEIKCDGVYKEVVLVDENETLKKIRPFLFLIWTCLNLHDINIISVKTFLCWYIYYTFNPNIIHPLFLQ